MSAHVLVVGGGVVGLCVAYWCARQGQQVTLVERGTEDAEGCSLANAGMVVPSHFVPLASPGVVRQALRWMGNPESPFYVKPRPSLALLDWGWKLYRAATRSSVERAAPILLDLHLKSRACYREWAASWGDAFEWVERGLLLLCSTEHGLSEEAALAAHAHRLGLAAEILTPAQAAELEPAVRMTIAGAVHFPLDSHLTPARLMTALRKELHAAGVQVRYGTPVLGWRARRDHVDAVRTAQGDLTADQFVVCAGVWSAELVRSLGLKLPLQAGKGYSFTLDRPPLMPRTCAILSEARVAITPMGGALRVGGTMELGGIDETIDPVRLRGIANSVARYYPDLMPSHFADATVRSGLRPCPPDGLPYIGRFRRFDNLSAATGHAMMGVSLAPITGKLVAELLSGVAPSCNIGALRPDRYS